MLTWSWECWSLALQDSPDSGKGSPRCGMAIAYIFHFPLVRVDSGLVSGDTGDSGLGISLFRFLQVPSKVPDGLMQVDAVVCFWDWGLFWAISRLSSWLVAFQEGLCLAGTRDLRAPRGLEKKFLKKRFTGFSQKLVYPFSIRPCISA